MPATKPSIVGQRFGMLLAVAKQEIRLAASGNKKERMWLFQCDCGNTTELSRWKVEKPKPQKSCGCLNVNRHGQGRGKKPVDILNQRFGNLLILDKTEYRDRNATVWRCLCDCGNIILMCIRRLNKGFRLNCGDAVHMPGAKKYPPTPNVLPPVALETIARYLPLVSMTWQTDTIDTAVEEERMNRLERASWIVYYRQATGEILSDFFIDRYIRKYLFFAKLGYYSRLRQKQRQIRRYTRDDSENNIRYPMTTTFGVSPEGNLQVKTGSPKIRKVRRVMIR